MATPLLEHPCSNVSSARHWISHLQLASFVQQRGAMIRSLLLVALLASTGAFATGERITITGAAAPLKDTLCISMNCVSGGAREFTVSGRAVKGGVELTVTSHSGQARLTHVARLNESNQISSIDLVHATSLVVQAIERGPIAPPVAPKAIARATKKPVKKGAVLARR